MKLLVLLCGYACLFGFVSQLVAEGSLVREAREHPDSFQANRRAATYLLSQKQLAAAIPFLEHASRADPANYPNAYDLALAYEEVGATSKSRQIILDLLRSEDRPELHNLLGDVEESDGHVDRAAHEYEAAARVDPSEKNVFDLGSDLLKHGAYEPALKALEFGVRRYPASARLHVALGIARYSLGQFDAAVDMLCQAVDLDPQDTKALEFLGKMQDISAQYAGRVRERLAHFAATYPRNSAANYYYALSLRKRVLTGDAEDRQRKDAEAYLKKAIQLSPHFSDAHFELGLLYEDEQRNEEAIQQYRQAIAGNAKLLKAHYHLARVYQKTGQKQQAETELAAVRALKDNQ